MNTVAKELKPKYGYGTNIFARTGELAGKVFYPVSQVQYKIALWILTIMVLLGSADVILRYIFNRPIPGAYELTGFLIAILTFLVLAETMVREKHVSVDMLFIRLSKKNQSFVRTINYLLALVLTSLASWQLVIYALTVLQKGDKSEILSIPVPPFVLVAAFGSVIFSGVLINKFFKSLSLAVKESSWRRILLLSVIMLVLILAMTATWIGWIPGDIPTLLVGVIGVIFLVTFMVMGMPIMFAFGVAGFWGFSYLTSIDKGLSLMGMSFYSTSSDYNFALLPLFVFMGMICFYSGLSEDLYRTGYKWVGALPGGLAMATIAGCAGFGAVCGSSVATAATLGTVAIPQMRKYKYQDALATGCIAAGGTLGFLIPPSLSFAVYGIVTQESIGKLFIAGIIPGILLTGIFMVLTYIMCKRDPLLGPPGPKVPVREKLLSIKDTWGVIVLFGLVMGGLYAGVFTASEAAAIGAFGALIFALIKRRLNWKSYSGSFAETAESAGMIIGMLLTADVFSYFLAVTRLPFELAGWVTGLDLPRMAILAIIILIYMVLGCLMPAIPMIVLTVPIFFPVITALNYDPIWFGVIITMLVEMAQITPPVGVNVYVIAGMSKVPMATVFRGIFPFVIADAIGIILIIAVPQIALFLPNLMT